MGFYLHIVSPTGERKEGKFIFKLAQAGAYLELKDDEGHGVAESKFIVRLDEGRGELVPLDPESNVVMDDRPPDWRDFSRLSLSNVPEYPEVDWSGDFFFGIACIEIQSVTEDKKDRREIASMRLSWATEGPVYLKFLQAMLEICDALGLQLVDGQGNFGVITRANCDAAVQNLTRFSSIIGGVLGGTRDDDLAETQRQAEELAEHAHLARLAELRQLPEHDRRLIAFDDNDVLWGISVVTYNILKRAGVRTLGDITSMTAREVSSLSGASERRCGEIHRVLQEFGLSLRPDD
jgi:hypothetical protein